MTIDPREAARKIEAADDALVASNEEIRAMARALLAGPSAEYRATMNDRTEDIWKIPDADCPACGEYWLGIRAMRMGGNRCKSEGCPMFTAQQITPDAGMARAIKLIEKRREIYIRENCKSIGNSGDWEGTVAQEEYVGELDDIIEMLRKETA